MKKYIIKALSPFKLACACLYVCILQAAAAAPRLRGHTRRLCAAPSTDLHPDGSRSALARSGARPQTHCHGEHTAVKG